MTRRRNIAARLAVLHLALPALACSGSNTGSIADTTAGDTADASSDSAFGPEGARDVSR